jgi:hypothetical protein
MKKSLVALIFFILFISCKNDNDLILSIENSNFLTYSRDSNKDTTFVVNYKLTNRSNDIYYINSISGFNNKSSIMDINSPNRYLRVYDKLNNELNYIPVFCKKSEETMKNELFNSEQLLNKNKQLGYNKIRAYDIVNANENSFFIHPNETIYFECVYLLQLNRNNMNKNFTSYVEIIKNKEYYCKLFLESNGINYKKTLPRNVLKTIEKNNVKVYHGTLESISKVSVKILD